MDLIEKLIPLVRAHTKSLILGIIGMRAFTVLSLLPPLLMRSLVNDVISPRKWGFLLPIAIAIAIVPIPYNILQFGNTWIIERTGLKFIRKQQQSM